MPEFKLKTGETVSGTVEGEDEHYIYRYWIKKEDLAEEEKPKEESKRVVEKVEAPEPRRRRRRR